jgi:hypothetical protein
MANQHQHQEKTLHRLRSMTMTKTNDGAYIAFGGRHQGKLDVNLRRMLNGSMRIKDSNWIAGAGAQSSNTSRIDRTRSGRVRVDTVYPSITTINRQAIRSNHNPS